jgi:hypothetical protein
MLKIKIGVLLAAVIAVFAVSIAPAMALKNFQAKPGSGTIKGKTVGNQIFKTKFGEVVCETAEASGKVTQMKTTEQELEFKYPASSCKIFGFVAVSISQEKYTFHINGEVKLNNEVKVESAGCKLIVEAGQTFSGEQVKYKNNGNNLKGEAKTTGVKYIGKGSTCESKGEKSSNGEYKGTEELEGNKPPELINVE